jgi:hypothetical protein
MRKRPLAIVSLVFTTLLLAYGCATAVDGEPDDSGGTGDGGQPGGGGADGGGGAGGSGASNSASSSAAHSSSAASSSAASSSSGGIDCGNGSCEAGETCQLCPGDCGPCCGNGICDPNESCQSCPPDCTVGCDCGNGLCQAGECSTCLVDCLQPTDCCGDGMCSFVESCATCPLDCGGAACCPSVPPGNASGPSILLFANYDGGQFTISVDVDVPNLVIGLVSYEAMIVDIVGPYAGNVVAVSYAGFDGAPTTSITGAPSAAVTIETLPPVPLVDPAGQSMMLCQYEPGCGTGDGCNTAAQAKDFFQQKFGGLVVSHLCQYGVYSGVLSTSVVSDCPL